MVSNETLCGFHTLWHGTGGFRAILFAVSAQNEMLPLPPSLILTVCLKRLYADSVRAFNEILIAKESLDV